MSELVEGLVYQPDPDESRPFDTLEYTKSTGNYLLCSLIPRPTVGHTADWWAWDGDPVKKAIRSRPSRKSRLPTTVKDYAVIH